MPRMLVDLELELGPANPFHVGIEAVKQLEAAQFVSSQDISIFIENVKLSIS